MVNQWFVFKKLYIFEFTFVYHLIYPAKMWLIGYKEKLKSLTPVECRNQALQAAEFKVSNFMRSLQNAVFSLSISASLKR